MKNLLQLKTETKNKPKIMNVNVSEIHLDDDGQFIAITLSNSKEFLQHIIETLINEAGKGNIEAIKFLLSNCFFENSKGKK